jgi:UDP-glucose 4-epimerase
MRVLVTGGAGYIGSHTCVELLEAGHEVFVVDNLSNGHEVALERVQGITNCELQFLNADIRDTCALDNIFSTFEPEAVIHFAGLKAVGDSVVNPLTYYDVNVGGSISLLTAMSKVGCKNIVFSSSATVYGNPQYLPYDENHTTKPINPYGHTKLMVENIIKDWVNVDINRKGTILRYFNPVGAHPSGQIGEDPHGIPNNLMPYISQVAIGKLEYLQIFGNDYETRDGTGARDYIHVVDLADAHIKTIHCQSNLESYEVINIGNGEGITVMELLNNFQRVSGVSIKYQLFPRRDGDLPASWADASLAFVKLGWRPQFTVDQMCKDTWSWQKNNTNGFNFDNRNDDNFSMKYKG